MKSFSISEAIKTGWNIFKGNWKLVLWALGISVLASIVASFVSSLIRGDGNNSNLVIVGGIVSLALNLGQMVLSIGLLKIAIMLASGQKPALSELWSNYSLFLNYLIMSIIVGAIVVVGLILLIIPGIYLGIRLQFAPYFLVDRKMAAIDAIRASWGATKGNVLSLVGLNLVLGLFNILGVILLLVGLLVTAPVTMLAVASVYLKLSKTSVQQPVVTENVLN